MQRGHHVSTEEADEARWRDWTRELLHWWHHYDWLYLGTALKAPRIELSESAARLGTWDRDQRILSISRAHVGRDPWYAVLETLRHEMAHQYSDEVLQAAGEKPHGAGFQKACDKLRVDASARATGTEFTRPEADDFAGDAVRSTIAKLLSLATSPNEHEAQAAMKKARHLLLKHNVELFEVRREGRRYCMRTLGKVKSRRLRWEYTLGGILADSFFVEVIYGYGYDAARMQRGRVLEVYGTSFNVEMAAYVHDYLLRLLPRLWTAYKAHKIIRSDRERRVYYAGVLDGFRDKLAQQDAYFHEELALIKTSDPELQDFCRYHHPQLASGSSSHTLDAGRAYTDGVEEGRRVTLRRPVTDRSGRGTRGFLASG